MPTVDIIGPYRFFFYSGDRDEPPHIHVERDKNKTKFWLDPIRLEYNRGFSRSEVNRIQKTVEQNRARFLRRWNEFFSD
ncbi:MAG: DUF4160 domain-containing protein [Chloroflexi bacterium]|nr:DUF4160 domain-containing protein [Chloroflexota bacterium]